MPEPLPNEGKNSTSSNAKTLIFMVILSFSCALILSLLASILAKPKELAKDLDRSKQMMIAAKILNHQGNFLIRDKTGAYNYAKYSEDGILIPGTNKDFATRDQIMEVYKKRLIPLLLDKKGNLKSFDEAGIDEGGYVADNRKVGYHKQPLKLLYKILANQQDARGSATENTEGYVIPINGLGLWDAIYGYLAISADGNTVIGTSWYDQKETPGLGANIAEEYWQNLFLGKKIFQAGADGKTDFKTAPIGILVVKGKVSEVLGNSPKAQSAVDGMAGATLTGNGVTDAYKEVLGAYRPFLLNLSQAQQKK